MNIEIVLAKEFEDNYALLPLSIKKKAEKQEEIFKENPFYTSLCNEKLTPKSKGLWSFRVDRKYRVVFKFLDKNTVVFLNIGPHDWIYKIKF